MQGTLCPSCSGCATILTLFSLLLVSLVALNAAKGGFGPVGSGASWSGRSSETTHHGATQAGSFDDVNVSSYTSVENATEPVVLYEYVPSPLTPNPVTQAFIGTEELHMSHLVCAGQFRWNKTCVFRNLYMDARPASRGNAWLFFASYTPDSSDAERKDLLAQLNLDVRVELNPFLRWESETASMGVS